MSNSSVVRAAARMTPRMAIFQAKRMARNRLVPAMPRLYERHILRTADRLPVPDKHEGIPLDLAEFIGAYYRASPEAMEAAARGKFTLLGRTIEFGSISEIDWAFKLPEETDHHLWRMKLAQAEIVHSLLASGRSSHQKTATALLERLAHVRDFSSRESFKIAWAPYGVSHRLLALLSGAAIATHAGLTPAHVQEEIAAFARTDAAFLWRNVEHDLRNNHTERNLAALCLFHMASGSISNARARALNRQINGLIRATVLPDGTQVERSAMYQGLTVMSLRLFSVAPFLSAATRRLASSRFEAAADAWKFLAHEDGEIALFNDSWLGEVPPPGSVVASSVPALSELPDGGYYRIASGEVSSLMDVGEIGPRWNPGHGHADFLSLEVDVHGRRLIVDPGTSQYSTGPRRTFERSSISHNGPRFEGVEPVDYVGCFKVGRLAAAVPIHKTTLDSLPVPSCGGTLETSAGRLSRIVSALPSGGLVVVDHWSAAVPRGAVTLLVPGTWKMSLIDDRVLEMTTDEIRTGLVVVRGSLGKLAESEWCQRFMTPERARTVNMTPEASPDGAQHLAFAVGAAEPSEADLLVPTLSTLLASLAMR